MPRYTIRFYRGDYIDRQRSANGDHAVCYVEHHFNGAADRNANYALVVVATNASSTSREWGRWYAREVAETFRIPNRGILVGGYQGRGNGNLRYTSMPAILLEPFFITNPEGARWARERQDELADILARSIREFFPTGGLVAFSVGHKYKRSNPNDRGVRSALGDMEADLAEQVLLKAQRLLEQPAPAPVEGDDEPPIPAAEVSPWAAEAYQWVVAQGITDGTRPQDPVTREEVWLMLHRALLRRPPHGGG